MAVHGQPDRLGPGHELALGAVPTFGRERCGDVRQRPGVRAELTQEGRPRGRRRRVRAAGRRGQSEGFVELPPGERLTPPVVADGAGGLAGQRERVPDPGQRGSDRKRLVDHLAAGVGEREQVAGEVAAVDGRHVRGLEPVQVARVVPVVEVTAEPFEAGDRGERRLQALHHVEGPDPAEIPSRHRREEVQPDVRRRGAMRDDRSGIVLEVVGRQRMVVRTDERLEVAPCPASGQADRLDVCGRELLGRGLGGRQADPSGDEGREQPQDDERRGDQARTRLHGEDGHHRDGGDRDAARHLPVEPGQLEVEAGAGLRRGGPFEEVPPGDVHPCEGPEDGVEHEPCLVGEERQAEAHVGRGDGDVRAHGSQVTALGDPPASRQRSGQDGQGRRDDDRSKDERGPETGGDGWERPGREEGGQRERSGHRPAQVVDHLPAGDPADGAPVSPARGVAGAADDPGQQLPVAARPAVLAGSRHQVVRGELIEELDIGHQAGPGEDALEEVVAQERVVGHPVRHRGGEGVQVVDPLAGEAPFLEQVLVDVRHRRCVRIDAGRPGEGPLEERCLALGGKDRR